MKRKYCKCKKCYGWKDYKCLKCGDYIKFGGLNKQPYEYSSKEIIESWETDGFEYIKYKGKVYVDIDSVMERLSEIKTIFRGNKE